MITWPNDIYCNKLIVDSAVQSLHVIHFSDQFCRSCNWPAYTRDNPTSACHHTANSGHRARVWPCPCPERERSRRRQRQRQQQHWHNSRWCIRWQRYHNRRLFWRKRHYRRKQHIWWLRSQAPGHQHQLLFRHKVYRLRIWHPDLLFQLRHTLFDWRRRYARACAHSWFRWCSVRCLLVNTSVSESLHLGCGVSRLVGRLNLAGA